MTEFQAIYPDIKRLINSNAVTRVNSYLGGYGTCDSLKEEIDGFGLSDRAREILTSAVCDRKSSISCPVR
ncbi:MAG TPA: hypothetical protein VLD55_06120 [Candidatus Sulfobium mesophilum]|nr:hypothetical protein [Candidatus Sulfobium mesophilum]